VIRPFQQKTQTRFFDLLEMRFDEVVEPEALSVDLVLYHQVGELVDVARSLQNGLRRQHGAIDFQHLTRNEVLKQLASKQPSE
jgi:aryl carrier-like protein